jgi:hypothetical protein
MLLSVHDGVKLQHTSNGEFRFERTPTDRFRLASLDTNSDTGTSVLRLPCINDAFPDAYEQERIPVLSASLYGLLFVQPGKTKGVFGVRFAQFHDEPAACTHPACTQ